MTELSDLPPLKRLQRYTELSQDARREAERSKGAVRESYLLIAEQWDRLAAELNKKIKADSGRG